MKISQISEHTLIPLGVAIAVLGGGAAWLTTLHWIANANAEKVTEIKVTVDKYDESQKQLLDSINQIKIDVSEIKGEIKYLRKQ